MVTPVVSYELLTTLIPAQTYTSPIIRLSSSFYSSIYRGGIIRKMAYIQEKPKVLTCSTAESLFACLGKNSWSFGDFYQKIVFQNLC